MNGGTVEDVHRRIRNILDAFPASGWDLAESEIVLAALAKIVRGRQAAGDVIKSADAIDPVTNS